MEKNFNCRDVLLKSGSENFGSDPVRLGCPLEFILLYFHTLMRDFRSGKIKYLLSEKMGSQTVIEETVRNNIQKTQEFLDMLKNYKKILIETNSIIISEQESFEGKSFLQN